MLFKVGDLVEYRMTGALNETVMRKVIVTSLDTFIGWVEVFDGRKTMAVPRYSLCLVGD